MCVASRTRGFTNRECAICLETHRGSFFISTEGCNHEYCINCCKRFAEQILRSGRPFIKCLDALCQQNYSPRQCRKLLSKSNYSILKRKRDEAAIHVTQRFYCPYEDCAVPMKKPMQKTFFRCKKCRRDVCLECKVPWHVNQTCSESRADNANERQLGFRKLQRLARRHGWQTCQQCNHMVERTGRGGCNLMVCVCGHQFCYLCGSRFVSCMCPIF